MQKQQHIQFATHSHIDILQPKSLPHNIVSMNHNPSGIPIAKDPITMNIVIKIEKSEFGFNGHLIISPKI